MSQLEEEIKTELMRKIRNDESLNEFEIKERLQKVPRVVLRKNWEQIEAIITDKNNLRQFIFQVFPGSDAVYKQDPMKFDKWLLRNMEVLYNTIYEYTWEGYI